MTGLKVNRKGSPRFFEKKRGKKLLTVAGVGWGWSVVEWRTGVDANDVDGPRATRSKSFLRTAPADRLFFKKATA
jgi:hypothetical protein